MKYLFNKNYIIYKVKKGDSLNSIAIKFNTCQEEVCKQNNISQNLYLGQTLFICPERCVYLTAKPFQDNPPFSRVKNYEHNLT